MQWLRRVAVVSMIVGLVVPVAPASATPQAPPPASPVAGATTTLESQPVPLQYAISAEVGAGSPSYHARFTAGEYRFAGKTDAAVAADRVTVVGNGESATIKVTGWGRDGALAPIAAPGEASRNRVTFAAGGISSWYVNGPLGVQQGWTVVNRPVGVGPLLVALDAGNPAVSADSLTYTNASGETWLRYRGLLAWDAAERPLSARFASHGDQVRIEVDDATAVYPVTIDPVFDVAALSLSVSNDGANLGYSVAVSADGAIVAAGAPGSQVDGSAKGAVVVFARPASGWASTPTPLAILSRGSAGATGDQLGISVSISSDGSVIAAGADLDATDGTGRGAVYVYTRQGGVWANQNGSTPSTTPARLTRGTASGNNNDRMGFSVSISADGSTIVAGALADDIDGVDNGALYVYTRQNGTWANQNGSTPATTPARLHRAVTGGISHQFGTSVAISYDGSTIISGAPGSNIDGSNRGAGFIYARPAGGWVTTASPTATLTRGAANSSDDDLLGISVATSGDGSTVVLGAVGDEFDGTDRGAAYIYVRPNGAWVSTSTFTARLSRGANSILGDSFGNSMAISYDGGVVVAGSWYDDRDGLDRGAAYLYQRPDNGWATTSNPTSILSRGTAEASAPIDQFGIAVAMSMNAGTIAVGINGLDLAGPDRGSVRVGRMPGKKRPPKRPPCCPLPGIPAQRLERASRPAPMAVSSWSACRPIIRPASTVARWPSTSARPTAGGPRLPRLPCSPEPVARLVTGSVTQLRSAAMAKSSRSVRPSTTSKPSMPARSMST